MTTENTITDFISHFKGSESVFLNGCCYWFAHILHERFGLTIMYEPVEGHFLSVGYAVDTIKDEFDERMYDVRGDVTALYKGAELYRLDWLKELEPTWHEHLMRDCRDFRARTEEDVQHDD